MTKQYKTTNSFKVLINVLLVSIILIINIWGSLSWADSKNTFNEISVIINGGEILNNKIYFSYVDNITERKINELSNKEILDIILSHPYVHAARTSYRYPDKIVIDIKEREPFAILNKDPIIILDQYCFVLPNTNNLDQYDKIIPCGVKDKGVTNLITISNNDYANLDKLLIEKFISILKI